MITCIGERIQKAMEKKEGLTPGRLATLIRMDPRRLGLILRDDLRPSLAEVERIARVLSVRISYLLAGVDESPSHDTSPNPELIQLLKDEELVVKFRLLGELNTKEQADLVKIIEGLRKKRKEAKSSRGGKSQC